MPPKISCLMVTRPKGDRLDLFKRSIHLYIAQTYPNKELVVVANRLSLAERARASAWVKSLKRGDIRWNYVGDKNPSLGLLRNRSIELCKGRYFCQWDDDDIYHPKRIQLQYEALKKSKSDAVYLEDVFHFLAPERKLAWVDWSRSETGCHPATVMASVRVTPRYEEVGRASHSGVGFIGEDAAFYRKMIFDHKVITLRNLPYLYTYVFHSQNVWNRTHHATLIKKYSVTSSRLRENWPLLERELERLPFGSGKIRFKSGKFGKSIQGKELGEFMAKKTVAKKSKARSRSSAASNSIYRLHPDMLSRKNADGTVLAISAKQRTAFYRVDGLAAKLWVLFDGKTPLSSLVKKLRPRDRAQMTEEKLMKSALGFVKKLEKYGLIEKAEKKTV